MSTALSFESVTKTYGRKAALSGLSFSVDTGSICGLVGSNGAGKTTTMSIAGGALKRFEGKVELLGQTGFDVEKLSGRLTVIPQDSELPRYARVEDLLSYYARLQGLSRTDVRRSVKDVLEWTNLGDRARSSIRQLSHGMRRRVTVAQAFLGNPELVLLDEPMNGLDPAEKANIRDLLIGRRGKQTILISSHNLDEVERVCDNVVFIEDGRLVKQESMEALTTKTLVTRYLVDKKDMDCSALSIAVPGCQFSQDAEGWLVCNAPISETAAAVNTRVLGRLLAQNVGVLRVETGATLEEIYLTDIRSSRPSS